MRVGRFIIPLFFGPTAFAVGLTAFPKIVALNDGDIVMRHGTGFWSERIMTTNRTDRRFSHAGIVSFREGNPYVIHADMDDRTLQGAVVETPWEDFIKHSVRAAAFRLGNLSQQERTSVAKEARKRIGRPFDFDFNLTSEDKIYCTELVYLCVNKAGGKQWITPTEFAGRPVVLPENCIQQPMTILMFEFPAAAVLQK